MTDIKGFFNEFKFLSNFWMCSIEFHGRTWSSVEHIYQALKFNSRDLQEEIRALPKPKDAKHKASSLAHKVRRDWHKVNLQIMYDAVLAKFSQNEKLKRQLIDTAPAYLEETNYWCDNFFGNCQCSRCRDTRGENHLGKILMQVRDVISNTDRDHQDRANRCTIHKGHNHFRVKADKNGEICPGFNGYAFIKRYLAQMEFDPRRRRFVKTCDYGVYDRSTRCFRFPIEVLDLFKKDAGSCGVFISEKNRKHSAQDVEFKILDGWEDRDYQKKAIEFLTTHPSSMKCLTLQTGQGKTYCAIRAAASLGHPFIVMTSGLLDQWEKAITQLLDISPDDVYVIQGSGSLLKLAKMDAEGIRPKVFIASTKTITNYVEYGDNYQDFVPFQEFVEYYGIGTKIVDEFHLMFHANVMIDLFTNIKHNVYLSATPKRSSKNEEVIFSRVYPEKHKYATPYKKYVDIFMYSYDVGYFPEKRYMTHKGYSHTKYEKILLSKPAYMNDFVGRILKKLIGAHYVNKRKMGQKLLILCSTIDMCKVVKKRLQDIYPDYKINTYLGSDPDSNLVNVDVIVSTPKSAGTGRDISDLLSVITTTSIGSEPQTIQILGRLRKLKNGDTPTLVDIFNCRIPSHHRHKQTRAAIYRALGNSFHSDRI